MKQKKKFQSLKKLMHKLLKPKGGKKIPRELHIHHRACKTEREEIRVSLAASPLPGIKEMQIKTKEIALPHPVWQQVRSGPVHCSPREQRKFLYPHNLFPDHSEYHISWPFTPKPPVCIFQE